MAGQDIVMTDSILGRNGSFCSDLWLMATVVHGAGLWRVVGSDCVAASGGLDFATGHS